MRKKTSHSSVFESKAFGRIFFTLFGIYWLILVFLKTHLEGDTAALITHTHGAIQCLSQGVWGHCPEAGHFPLIQQLLTLPLVTIGVGDEWMIRLLAYLNAAIFLFTFLQMKKHFTDKKYLWLLLALILSPFIHYSRSSFGETLAACLHVLLVLSLVKSRAPLHVFLLALLCGVTKDTVHVFTIGIGLLSSKKLRSPQTLALILGCASGFLAQTTLQYFRFGVPYNAFNLQPLGITPMDSVRSFFLAQWISPNAGIPFYWPIFAMMALLVLWRKLSGDPKRFLHLALMFSLLLALTFGLAHWWSPFGWRAWGPRLSLPLLLPLFVLLIEFHGDAFLAVWPRLTSGARVSIVSLMLVLSVPQIMVTAVRSPMIAINTEPSTVCQVDFRIDENPKAYYDCMDERLWRPKDWIVFRAFRLIVEYPETVIILFIYSGVILSLLFRLRKTQLR